MDAAPMLLDQIMLKTGCFEKPCRLQVLKQICQLAIQPYDETAQVIEGSSIDMRDNIESSAGSETLFLHNFDQTSKSKPDPIRSTESPKQVCLSHCHLNSLKCFANVETLILWKCSFTSVAKMANLKALVVVDSFVRPSVLREFLEGSKSLERLALIRAGDVSRMGRGDGYCLSPSNEPLLFHTRKLTEITLQSTLLPCQDLVHNVQANQNFRKLSISHTWLPDSVVAWISHAMGMPSCSLEEFSIKEIQWSPNASLDLVKGLHYNTGIKCLDLSSTLWQSYPRVAFCHFLRHHATSVEEITLESMVDPSMISDLLEACIMNNSLKKIMLARNFLDQDAMCSLKKLLKAQSLLKEVHLSECFAHDEGSWEEALLGLSFNTSLNSLSLERCQIGDQGAEAIAKSLGLNTTLKTIDLCHNCIGVDGAAALVQGLRVNHTLQQLFFHGNNDEAESAVLFRNLVRDANTSLRVVFLPESCLQEELQYYGSLNFAGRKYVGDPKIETALWPTILERAAAMRSDVVFFLLQQKPDLLLQARGSKKRPHLELSTGSSGCFPESRRLRRKL